MYAGQKESCMCDLMIPKPNAVACVASLVFHHQSSQVSESLERGVRTDVFVYCRVYSRPQSEWNRSFPRRGHVAAIIRVVSIKVTIIQKLFSCMEHRTLGYGMRGPEVTGVVTWKTCLENYPLHWYVLIKSNAPRQLLSEVIHTKNRKEVLLWFNVSDTVPKRKTKKEEPGCCRQWTPNAEQKLLHCSYFSSTTLFISEEDLAGGTL